MEKIGILWDLDGTIVDTVDLYYRSCIQVFEKHKVQHITPTIEKYRGIYFGKDPALIFRDHTLEPVTDEQIAAMKWDFLQFADQFTLEAEDGELKLIPGVDRILDGFYAKGYPMALASTSWMPTAVHMLEKIGYLTKFTNISSGFLLPSKPAPDVFRIASEMIAVRPERCVVFEDSLAGMKGAKNAGMKCIGINTSVPVSEMVDADIRLERYADLRIEDAEALFA